MPFAMMEAERYDQAHETNTLIDRCAHGDKQAFRRLYDLESSRLYSIALRITRHADLAADALHDTLLHVWKNANRFDSTRDNARVWMISLIRRRALTFVAQNRAEKSSETLLQFPDQQSDPLKKIASSQEGARLLRCIKNLKGHKTDLVVMAFIQGLTHSEVAARTQHPLGTVKSSIRRTLVALRNCLEAHHG